MGNVNWRGVTLDSRSAAMMDEVVRLCPGINIDATQGSFSGSVSASAGTHSGCGAIDLAGEGYSNAHRQEIVKQMRRVGWAAWLRTPAQSDWPYHIHGIAVQPGGKGDRGCLHASAHDQVVDYYENRNGLASNGKDDGPRDFVGTTWESYSGGTPPPSGGGDDDMTPEQAQLLGNIGWAVDQIRGTDLPPIRQATDRVVHVQDSTDKTEWGVLDEDQGLRTMVADLAKAVARIEDKLDS